MGALKIKVGDQIVAIAAGPAGADGRSAYEVALDVGFVGSEQEWLDSLVGPVGPAGPAGADGLQPRATAVKTTAASLADGATEVGTIAMATGYRVSKIQTDVPARVRLYATAAQRDADVSRAIGTDPTGDHGLLLEYVTTASQLTGTLTPVVDGYSLESTPSTGIPITITNLSGAAGSVTTTLTYQRTE